MSDGTGTLEILRILVMGNSHVAALMDATRHGAAAEFGLAPSFAALGGSMFRALYAEDGRLRIREDVARGPQLDRFRAMKMENFDLSSVDVIYIYSSSFVNVQEFIHVPLTLRLEEGRWFSRSFAIDCLRDYVRTRRLVAFAETFVAESGGRPVVICHPPFRTREHSKLEGVDVPQDWRDALLAACDECFARPGLATMLQPKETIEEVAFTFRSFTDGCTTLDGAVRDRGIESHMNAAYGRLWLRDAARLARRLAPRAEAA